MGSKDMKNDNDKNMDINMDIDAVNVPPLLRAVSYICMTPKLKVKSKDIIRQRIAAYETHSTCSHWPQNCQILHKPSGMKEQSINNIKDDLIKSLIGMDMLWDDRYKNVKNECDNTDNGNNGGQSNGKWRNNKGKKNKNKGWKKVRNN